jgi:hypothetical protein
MKGHDIRNVEVALKLSSKVHLRLVARIKWAIHNWLAMDLVLNIETVVIRDSILPGGEFLVGAVRDAFRPIFGSVPR